VRGVAPAVKFTVSQMGSFATFANAASAYTYAESQAVDVHSNSWGYVGLADPPVVVDAIQSAFDNGRGGLGMVILFASGNDGMEVERGFELSTLPTVIGVGGSTANDVVSVGSNYGPDIDVLAPTNIGDFGVPWVVTTDVTDGVYSEALAGFVFPIDGYNVGGGGGDLDDPSYTNTFGGTSAACPIAAGTVALVLSANPGLTATQVRMLLEHTSDKIAAEPEDPDIVPAGYHGITGRSLKYGYGRINAGAAVAAAADLVATGLTWPDRVANVVVGGNTLIWESNDDLRGDSQAGERTEGFLLVESVGAAFAWIPEDGVTYSVGEEVEAMTPDGFPLTGVTVVYTGEAGRYDYEASDSTRYFALFARNGDRRYSWGAAVDSEGNVEGAVDKTAVIPTGPVVPLVSITAIPVSGTSPLTVEFRGNALTESGVASEEWDFGDGATDTQSTTTHTYTVPDGESQTFIATFTVVDVDGQTGSKSLSINVVSPVTGNTNDNGDAETTVTMILTDDEGRPLDTSEAQQAPLRVYFSVDVTRLTLDVSRVVWSFGDGSSSETGISATHEYESEGSFAAAVEVYVETSAGVEVADPYSDYEVIPVSADPNANANANDNTGGGTGTPNEPGAGNVCGLGILMPFAGVLLMTLGRRRLR